MSRRDGHPTPGAHQSLQAANTAGSGSCVGQGRSKLTAAATDSAADGRIYTLRYGPACATNLRLLLVKGACNGRHRADQRRRYSRPPSAATCAQDAGQADRESAKPARLIGVGTVEGERKKRPSGGVG